MEKFGAVQQRQKNTAEVYYGRSLFLWAVIGVFYLIVGAVCTLLTGSWLVMGGILILAVTVILPFLLYFGLKLRCYRRVELTDLQTVTLEKTTGIYGGTHVAFTVEVIIGGQPRVMETRADFSNSVLSPLAMQAFIATEVTVGYYGKKDELIVLMPDPQEIARDRIRKQNRGGRRK